MSEPGPNASDRVTSAQQAELDELASELGQVLPDGLDAAGADRLIAEFRDRVDHAAQTYSSE
jgi:hypothetical protein